MKTKLLSQIQCPNCMSNFEIINPILKNEEVYSGNLNCVMCNSKYPITNYIPRFVIDKNYSASWGVLWKKASETMRDSYTKDTFYYDTIFGKWSEDNIVKEGYNMFGFNWPKKMKNEKILEIGPGNGVCTEHLVKTDADIISVDMSNSVDTFPESLLTHPSLNVLQADINSGVIKKSQFDRIWLFQVLQHTPSPLDTLKTVRDYLKEEGKICFTSYSSRFYPFYLFITKRMSFNAVYLMLKIFLPVKYYLQKFFVSINLNFMAKACHTLMQPVDPRNIYFNTLQGTNNDTPPGKYYLKTKDKKILFWHTVINTFDRITPEYTNGAEHDVIEKWTKEAGYNNIEVWGKSGVRVKATK